MTTKLKPPDPPAGVPTWVLSFGDMVTNLMACFVLLLSLASTQDRTLFNAGMGSYRRVISQYGLPDWLVGKAPPSAMDFRSIKYPTEAAPDDMPRNKQHDAEDERIRNAFKEMTTQIETRSSGVGEKLIETNATRLSFAQGQSDLDEAAKMYLLEQAVLMAGNLRASKIRIYVIGLAADVKDSKQQWLLSAQRAAKVEAFLRECLQKHGQAAQWELDAQGAGNGGSWRKKLSLTRPEQVFIILAVTQVKAGEG